jgi:hypothetical protein
VPFVSAPVGDRLRSAHGVRNSWQMALPDHLAGNQLGLRHAVERIGKRRRVPFINVNVAVPTTVRVTNVGLNGTLLKGGPTVGIIGPL